MRSVLPLFVVLMACGGDDPAADSAADTAGLLATPGGETPSGSAGTATADPHANTYIPPGYGATDPSRIVFLGDSITTGAGASKSSLANGG